MPKPREKPSPAGSAPQPAEGFPTREEIELRAYHIFLERGGAPGQDLEDWLQAERELLEKHRKTGRIAGARAA